MTPLSPLRDDWKIIPGTPFEANSDGAIRRYLIGGRGSRVGKVLRGCVKKNGYHFTNGMYTHRLVCSAFLGPCPEGMEVNHRNGIKTDNRIENLEYVTHKKNGEHASETGLIPQGCRSSNSRLGPGNIRVIRALGKFGHTHQSIADLFRVSGTCIRRIIKGHRYKAEATPW